MNELFKEVKNLVLSRIPEIPKHITEKWLLEALKNNSFSIWGFSFADLSQCVFDDFISKDVIRRVSVSTYTKLPQKHPFNLNLSSYIDEDIQLLHEQGINGSGINIAVIDQKFSIIPEELKHCLKSYVNCQPNYSNYDSHFHGSVVTSILAGKNYGVAPYSNISFYGKDDSLENSGDDTIKALKDILDRNLNGANIKIVCIASSIHALNSEYLTIRQELIKQGCNIIDSPTFGRFIMGLTCVNERNINGKRIYNYSKWQYDEGIDNFNNKIAVPFTGITPLWNTKQHFQIGGDVTYSWTIPRLAGIYALCLQLKKDMSLEELRDLIIETKITTEEGIKLINPKGMIEKLTIDLESNKKL